MIKRLFNKQQSEPYKGKQISDAVLQNLKFYSVIYLYEIHLGGKGQAFC